MKHTAVGIFLFAIVLSQAASAQEFKTFRLGTAVQPTPLQRTVVIRPDTDWINVTEGESVKFIAGASEFAWRFDGPRTGPFNLQQVAPDGAVVKPITVFVTRLPEW